MADAPRNNRFDNRGFRDVGDGGGLFLHGRLDPRNARQIRDEPGVMAMANTTTLPEPHWYIVHAYSNFEKKVADEIKKQAISHGLADLFEEVLVPTEEVVEIRRGQKVNAERKFFPGYVLVKARLTDEAYHLIKNTPKVTGFLGTGSKPIPVRQAEVDRILNQ